MKSIYKYMGMAALAVSMGACGDGFLTVDSPTQIPSDEYFSTKDHLEEAVVAAYDPLQWTDWSMNEYAPFTLMSDIMADDLWVGGANATDNENWHMMFNYSATPLKVVTSLWIDGFSGVKRCNDVLEAIEGGIEDATQAELDYYTAQVKVLRAFYANWLWKFYGNVPYYERNLTEPYIQEQMSADNLYEHMVADIEDALALKTLAFRASDAEAGRVTTAMAYMLYAEIVMYQKDTARYPQALKYMKEIIASADYDLEPDYTRIFKEEGEWCKESIWEINYISENAVRDWDAPLNAGGTVLPTLIGPNNWPSGKNGYAGGGWGFAPVRLETYERYSADDVRRDATCADFRDFQADYTQRYQDYGIFLEKYIGKDGGNAGQKASGELNFNNNWRIYRYSEALLNAAELLVATGGSSAEAKGYLNQVRERAGLRTQLEPTLDNIIEERHLEFVGEGKRYWDLIRTDKAASVLVPDEYGYRTNTWTPNKKYLPIPQSEIDRSMGTLTQNPY